MPESGGLTSIDPVNYPKPPVSDDQGRIVFPALIPGTTYQVVDRSTAGAAPGLQLRKEFTVKPGEALDLGDILIQKSEKREVISLALGWPVEITTCERHDVSFEAAVADGVAGYAGSGFRRGGAFNSTARDRGRELITSIQMSPRSVLLSAGRSLPRPGRACRHPLAQVQLCPAQCQPRPRRSRRDRWCICSGRHFSSPSFRASRPSSLVHKWKPLVSNLPYT